MIEGVLDDPYARVGVRRNSLGNDNNEGGNVDDEDHSKFLSKNKLSHKP